MTENVSVLRPDRIGCHLASLSPPCGLKRKIHCTIRDVTRDISEEKQFNTAVARLMELLNALAAFRPEDADGERLFAEGVDVLISCLNPFCPHITEELWALTGHGTPLAKNSWPEVDPASLEVDSVTIVVQINGKVREKTQLPAGLSAEELERAVLALPAVQQRLEGTEIRKIISVPDRLVNVVVKG